MKLKDMTIEELRERAALIAQIRADLEAIRDELEEPSNEVMDKIRAHRADLEAINEDYDYPDDITMEKIRAHRADLEEIAHAAAE